MPLEGIFETFECIELTYTVDAEKILKTKLGAVTTAIWLCRRIWRWFGLSSISSTTGDARRSWSM